MCRSKWTSADRLFIENYQRMILETEAHYHAHTTDVNHHSPLSPGGKDANVAVSEHLCNQQLRRTSDAFNAKDVASCKKVKLDERIMEEASVQCVVDAPLTHYCCPYSPSNSTNNFHGDHLTLTTTDHNDNDDVIADGYNRKRNCVDVLDGDCYYFRCGDTYHALSYDDFIFTVDDVNSATASSEDFLSTSCVASYAEPDFASICGGVYSDNCSLAAARDPYASADWLSSPVHAASHLRGISHGNSPIHAWTGSKSRSLFSTNSGLLTDKENFAPDTATVAVGTNGSHHMGPGRQEGGEEEVDNSPVWSITSRIQVPSRIFLSAVEVHAASAYVPPNLTMSQ